MLLQAILRDVPLWQKVVALVALAAFAAWAFETVVMKALRSLTSRTKTQWDDFIIKLIHPMFAVLVFVLLLWGGIRFLDLPPSERVVRWVDNSATVVTMLVAAIALSRGFRALFVWRARRHPRWDRASTLASRGISLVIYVIALLMILTHFDVQITPLIASLGIGALAIGLALQDTLANFFAGIWVQAGGDVPKGHLVEFQDPPILGFVEDIGWRVTRIRTLPNNLVIIPNSTVAKATITDYDLPMPRMGANMTIMTGFEADPNKVVEILLDSVNWVAQNRKDLGILSDPPPASRLNDITERGLAFWLGFQCESWFHQWNGGGAIRTRILERFKEEGIRTPYPMREIFVVPPERRDVADSPAAGNGDGSQRTKPQPASANPIEAAGPVKPD